MVSVGFLGRKFILPLLSIDYSINHCFDDILEQQGIALKKLHMHINPKYFNWMVFVIGVSIYWQDSDSEWSTLGAFKMP